MLALPGLTEEQRADILLQLPLQSAGLVNTMFLVQDDALLVMAQNGILSGEWEAVGRCMAAREYQCMATGWHEQPRMKLDDVGIESCVWAMHALRTQKVAMMKLLEAVRQFFMVVETLKFSESPLRSLSPCMRGMCGPLNVRRGQWGSFHLWYARS
jgi:hypothetical protein